MANLKLNNVIVVAEASGTATLQNSIIKVKADGIKASDGTAAITIANSTGAVSLASNLSVAGNATVTGNLTVNGATTTVNSTTLTIDDKNIELGRIDNPTDTTADGGGITLKGATDKTILWTNSTDSWDFNKKVKAPTLEVTGDIIPSEPLSNRNMIINGGMTVWQRATSAVTVTQNYDTADRWRLYDPISGSYTSEKHTMSAAELNTTGHRNALKLACTGVSSAGAGDHAYFLTMLEGQDCQRLQYGTANAKTVTLSFWVKSSKAGIYTISVYSVAATNYQIAIEYTISSADTWEYKTINITPTAGSTSLITSSGGLIADNNGQALTLYFGLLWGSNVTGAANNTWVTGGTAYGTANQVNWLDSTSNRFYITGIQVEVGANATPFEHRSYGDELERCQRYFQILGKGGSAPLGEGIRYESNVLSTVDHPVVMRANPTVYSSDGTGHFRILMKGAGYLYNTTSGFNDQSVYRTQIKFSSFSGGNDGDGCYCQLNHSDAYFGFNAEL